MDCDLYLGARRAARDCRDRQQRRDEDGAAGRLPGQRSICVLSSEDDPPIADQACRRSADLEDGKITEFAEPALKLLQTNKADYDKEVARLETNAKNGKKELLAKAENCENERNLALAEHPFYDYSMAMLQIAIVLASASIITGARLLLGGSGLVGLFGILLFLNGYTLVYGGPSLKHDKADALEKLGVHISLQCIVE